MFSASFGAGEAEADAQTRGGSSSTEKASTPGPLQNGANGGREPPENENYGNIPILLRVSTCERWSGWRLASAWRMACRHWPFRPSCRQIFWFQTSRCQQGQSKYSCLAGSTGYIPGEMSFFPGMADHSTLTRSNVNPWAIGGVFIGVFALISLAVQLVGGGLKTTSADQGTVQKIGNLPASARQVMQYPAGVPTGVSGGNAGASTDTGLAR